MRSAHNGEIVGSNPTLATNTMRYLKQQDDYSCGPIALMNILKWLGHRVLYKDLPKYKQLCYCDDGTWAADLESAMCEYFEPVDIAPSITAMDKHLVSGGIVLFGYEYEIGKRECAHWVLCTEKRGNGYLLVNEASHRGWDESLPTIYRRSRDKIKRMVRRSSDMWLIRKPSHDF